MSKIKNILLVALLFCCIPVSAQEVKKSDLQQRAESADESSSIATARFLYIRAFEDYIGKGQTEQGIDCAIKATTLYYKKDNYYQEAFDLLHRADDAINADGQKNAKAKAALHYRVTKERLQMYMKMRKSTGAMDQLNIMETQANTADDDNLKTDVLYNKALYYYSFGQNAQAGDIFKEMANKLTAQKEYDKVDEVYQTLISNGRKSGSASLVAQSYRSYMAWKDSVSALKTADQIGALKQQIADNEASIAEKDGSLAARQWIITGLCILAAALAAALVLTAIVLLRYIVLTRKQKNTIRMLNDNNALKAKFISNISAQLGPTLQKLDSRQPEVKALLDFSNHVQQLSQLECTADEAVLLEDISIPPFCESLMDQIRPQVKRDVSLTVNAPKMNAKINQQYVGHILQHLLSNAADHTPEGGRITLEFKKRSAHTYQFLVSDTGEGIPEDKRDDVFKPFLEVHDLTTGDGLGLPICRQMAHNMDGELTIDPDFTKGTRFVLELHV